MEVVNALVRNHIDVPRARLILRALSIAARNATKVRFDCWQSDMVKEVPDYPTAPPVTGPFAIPTTQAAALTSISKPQQDEPKHAQPSSTFQTASGDVQENVQRNLHRKPPASVKTSGRARAASRTG